MECDNVRSMDYVKAGGDISVIPHLITANQPFGDWDTLFPDKIMSVAIMTKLK